MDYLKYDWCNTEALNSEGAYLSMRNALFTAGRPVVLSICEWGENKPWLWAKDIGHLWRTTGDIINCFYCIVDHGTWNSWGIMQILDKQDGLREYAGPGHWNDPDMMEVGNGMTVNEDRAHFSMWCMLAAPLIAGNDLRNMSKETIAILTNNEAISINQDSLGFQGFKYLSIDSLEIWFKPLTKNNWAMCLLNRGSKNKNIEFNWNEHKIYDSFAQRGIETISGTYKIFDIWNNVFIGDTKNLLKVTVNFRDVTLLKLLKN